MKWLNRKQKLAAAQSYALYYGVGCAEDLAKFDVAIVEPAGQTTQSLKRMQESGTLVVAYLSIMEIADYAEEYRLLQRQDFLMKKNEIMKNEQYDTYIVDVRSPLWQEILVQKASGLLQKGYDGLFLDTIGDVENLAIPSDTRDELIMSVLGILRNIKKASSGHVLIQNSGLERLCLYTASLLDGICWENPPITTRENEAWVKTMQQRLKQLQKEHGLKVLMLFEDDMVIEVGEEKKKAEEQGFLFYQASKGYVTGVKKITQ